MHHPPHRTPRGAAPALLALGLVGLAVLQGHSAGQPSAKDEDANKNGRSAAEATLPADWVKALTWRSIGPANMGGRVTAISVYEFDPTLYWVATGGGGLLKTTNNGITFEHQFDREGTIAIGDVCVAPSDKNVVWVGTGENNPRNSVSYGDGVYKSTDGGRSWANVGLKQSEHIGKILIDPRNPDVLVAASYQRRRHVWTLINGGPGSAIHRSTDGGKTWKKVTDGLPKAEFGRIGLAIAPTDPDTVYAIIEAADRQGGIFRSTDRGLTWEKRNPFDQQAQYYAHVTVDPANKDRLYVMNVLIQVSDDGGKTLAPLGERWKHVDSHFIWVDPKDPKYYLVGCDGGIYESFDRGANWHFKPNLPITQFYDVTCDESGPFYHVYGGTQDNFTLGGRRARAPFTASSTRTGSSPRAATGSTARSTRPIPTSSTPRCSTAGCAGSTGGPASGCRSSRRARPASRRCGGTGTAR